MTSTFSAAPPNRSTPDGLTDAEVEQRRRQGLANGEEPRFGATYGEIVRRNLITFINVTLISVGVVLVVVGQPKDAILTSMLAILSAVVGVIQEVIAKRRLDRIALLNRVPPVVRRNGEERPIDATELVVGDVVVLHAGSQVPLDGRLVAGEGLQVDESLLTGESDHVAKQPGDSLYSGSFCVAGDGYLEVEKVGAGSVMASISAEAKSAKHILTPLQQQVNRVTRLLILVALLLLAAVLIQDAIFWHSPFWQTVTAAAIILGIVPPGLFMMITVTYSTAAARLAARDALAQQVNAIESLSYVDMFCMDKTGTLTTNRLQMEEVQPLRDLPEDQVRTWLGALAVSVPGANKTSEAIAAAIPAVKVNTREGAPFASSRRWSGMSVDDGPCAGTFVLGAPEVIRAAVSDDPGGAPQEWLDAGLRVLCLASADGALPLTRDGEPALPDGLRASAWLAFRDELRPHLHETLEGFRRSNVALKVISGDNPETVAALARQAGIAEDAGVLSGADLADLADAAFDREVARTTVFGRIEPSLKQRIVDSLRRQGHYVAMTGDGVNDIPSLKKAQVGIAMQSGSQATRATADIVLLNDSFAALPAAIAEGQRIRRGLQKTLYLFLSRVFAVAAIIALTSLLHLGFPFLPGHMTVLTLLTVGIPTFALALFAPPGPIADRPMHALLRFVAPAVVMTALAAFTIYTLVYVTHDIDFAQFRWSEAVFGFLFTDANVLSRDALTWVLVLCGLWLVVFAAPPTPWFAVAETLEQDWRPTWVAIAMVPLYAVFVAVEPLRAFFGLNRLPLWLYVLVAVVTSAWMVALREVWTRGWADRWFVDTRVGRWFERYLIGRMQLPNAPNVLDVVAPGADHEESGSVGHEDAGGQDPYEPDRKRPHRGHAVTGRPGDSGVAE